jgi:hypothetical protein
VNGLGIYAYSQLEKAVSLVTPAQISTDTYKCVRKRVSAKIVSEYATPQNVLSLIILDIQQIGDRIRLCPFTAKYREQINLSSNDMVTAWQLHSHSLRQSELYIIQERGTEVLQFLHFVARDFKLKSVDCSNSFEREFKKRFERRLRERHRLVHAHEKPSLVSRLIDLMVSGDNERAVGQALGEVLAKVASIMPGPATDDPKEALRRLRSLGEQYAMLAEKEAIDMFDLFSEAVIRTITGTSVVQSENQDHKP